MKILDTVKSAIKSRWRKRREHRLLVEQNRFILSELRRINVRMRCQLLDEPETTMDEQDQTRSSFDYQWACFNSGGGLSNDRPFMDNLNSLVCQMTDLPSEWFSGKKVVDIGCGAGRFTYGMLSLGASVTACDQIRRTMNGINHHVAAEKD